MKPVMPHILVTGGAGYIGSHAVKKLLRTGYQIFVIDNFCNGYREPLEILSSAYPGMLQIRDADLRDSMILDEVFSKNTFDAVMHFAALCSVDESVAQPDLYRDNNVQGTVELLKAMKRHGVHFLIFSSTCAVYGNAISLPITEDHPTRPTSPYGSSKLEAERIIQSYEKKGIHSAILRYFNVCGSDSEGEIGDSKKPSSLLVQNAVRGALGIEPFAFTFAPTDTPDGSPIRDYIDVEDLVDAHIRALECLSTNKTSFVCNLGTGKGSSVIEIVAIVEKELGVTLKKANKPFRRGEYPQVYADPQRAETILHWQATTPIETSIKKMVRWYRRRPQGYTH